MKITKKITKNIHKLFSRKIIITLVIGVIVILLIVSSLYFVKKYQDKRGYSDPKYGWHMDYAPNWKLNLWPSFNNSTTSDLDIQFQLKHTSGCTLTLGKIKTYSPPGEFGVRFDRPGIAYENFTKSIYLDGKNFTLHSLQDYDTGAIMGAYINNFPEINSPYTLVLLNNNTSLSDTCVTDFISLFKNNIKLKNGGLYTISPSSNGFISIQREQYSLRFDPECLEYWKCRSALVFGNKENSNTQTLYKYKDDQVIQYLDLRDVHSFGLNLQIMGDNLFFINSAGKISLTNIISKEIQVIDLPGVMVNNDSNRISNFLVHGSKLLYLIGQDCRSNQENKCNLSLHEYNLESKKDVVLAGEVNSSNIMGYDSVGNKLFMNHVVDDSCAWEKIQEYDFKTKKVVETVSTASDPDCTSIDAGAPTSPAWDKVDEIYKRLGSQTVGNRHLKIEDGKVVEDSKPNDEPYGVGIRFISK